MSERMNKVAICQHCNAVVIIACMQDAELDSELRKDFRKAAKDGLTISAMTTEEFHSGKQPFGHTSECPFTIKRNKKKGIQSP